MSKISGLFFASLLVLGCRSVRDDDTTPAPASTPTTASRDTTEDRTPTYSTDDNRQTNTYDTDDSDMIGHDMSGDDDDMTDPDRYGRDTAVGQGTTDTTDTSDDTTATAELNDTSILAIVSQGHQQEIDAGTAAKSKTTNAGVKAFAQMLVDDHTAALRQTKQLAERLGLSQTDDEATAAMKDEAEATKTRLDALDGAEFDQAFLDEQVRAHQSKLDRLDKDLIPGAEDSQVRDLLKTQRAKVQAHLDHAKRLQKDQTKTKTNTTPQK
jgi:putative membrane protein